MAQPKIKPVKVGDRTRYRFVVDIGTDPATGKRRQLTKTFDGKRQAERELARILTEVGRGTYAGPWVSTLTSGSGRRPAARSSTPCRATRARSGRCGSG